MNASVQGLLKPPKLPVQLEEIRKVIDEKYKRELVYIHPVSGKHTNAVQFVDLNGDGIQEVFVFHREEKSEEPLRIILLSKDESGWNLDETIKGIGFDVSKITYEDIDSDGTKEILVGWQGGNTTKKGLSIYKYKKGTVERVFESAYTEFSVGDLTGNGKKELILIDLDRSEGLAKATLYDSRFIYMDEVNMEGFINGYYSVKVGKASSEQMGCFIDVSYGAHSAFTDLLVYKDGELINVFYDLRWRLVDKTYKPYPIASSDIDGDGIVEIPLLRKPFGYEGAPMAETEWITTWNKWDGRTGLVFNSESYSNGRLDFELQFPQEWKQNVTVDISGDGLGNVIFSYIEAYSKKRIPLLEIAVTQRSSEKGNKETQLENGFSEWGRTLDHIYYGKTYNLENVENSERMHIPLEVLKKGFKPLNKSKTR